MLENKKIYADIIFKKNALPGESIYYALKWTREGTVKLIKDPTKFTVEWKNYNMSELLDKLQTVSLCNPGVIENINIYLK